MSGYVEIPEGWEVVSEDGPGPFVTSEILRRPGGSEVRWRSRAHRKGDLGRAAATQTGTVGEPVWWRPRRRGWWMSVLFAVGSLCFAVAAVASQWASSPRPAIGVTFFVGSIFFTCASYLQYSETVNVERGPVPHAGRRRSLSWWIVALNMLGSIAFAVVLTASEFLRPADYCGFFFFLFLGAKRRPRPPRSSRPRVSPQPLSAI